MGSDVYGTRAPLPWGVMLGDGCRGDGCRGLLVGSVKALVLLDAGGTKLAERRIGGTALFFNGAEGDVAPVGSGREAAERVGDAVGREALAVRSSLVPTDEIRLGFAYCQLDDPGVPPAFSRACPERLEGFQLRPLKQALN